MTPVSMHRAGEGYLPGVTSCPAAAASTAPEESWGGGGGGAVRVSRRPGPWICCALRKSAARSSLACFVVNVTGGTLCLFTRLLLLLCLGSYTH